MKIELSEFFKGYYKAGYLLQNKEPRNLVLLVSKDGSKTSMSYARYLMSSHLNKFLSKTEHVDHIDGDKLNDVIENLQVLSPKDNNIKKTIQSGKTLMMVEMKCPNCCKNFIRRKGNSHLQKKNRFSSCSKECLHEFLKNGYSLDYLTEVGKNQIVRFFRK